MWIAAYRLHETFCGTKRYWASFYKQTEWSLGLFMLVPFIMFSRNIRHDLHSYRCGNNHVSIFIIRCLLCVQQPAYKLDKSWCQIRGLFLHFFSVWKVQNSPYDSYVFRLREMIATQSSTRRPPEDTLPANLFPCERFNFNTWISRNLFRRLLCLQLSDRTTDFRMLSIWTGYLFRWKQVV